MNALIATLLAWIVAQTGLAIPDPPEVALVPAAEIVERAYGPCAPKGASATALYDRDTATIYLAEDWRPDDLRQRSTFLHELVHHVQTYNRVEAPCVAAHERQAYNLQLAWLREQGVEDPYAFLGIDAFTIAVLSMCPETE